MQQALEMRNPSSGEKTGSEFLNRPSVRLRLGNLRTALFWQ